MRNIAKAARVPRSLVRLRDAMSGVRSPRPILLEVTPTSHQQLAAASRRSVLVDGAERFNAFSKNGSMRNDLRALLGFLCHGGQRCAVEWLPADAGVTEQRRAFSRAAVALTTLDRAARLSWMRRRPSVAALLVPAGRATGALDDEDAPRWRSALEAGDDLASGQGPPAGSSGEGKAPSSNVRVWWHAAHRSAGVDGVAHGVDLAPGWSDFRLFVRWLFRCEATREALQTDTDRQAVVAAAERARRAAPAGAEAAFAEESSAVVAAVLQGEASQPETRRRGDLAVHMLQAKRAAQPATGDGELAELKNLICVAQLAGLHHHALLYARELLAAPGCALSGARGRPDAPTPQRGARAECFCTTAGNVVNLLRAGADPGTGPSAAAHRAAADAFFEADVRTRVPSCGYTSSWQMPAPSHLFAPAFAAHPWHDPDAFHVGRALAQPSFRDAWLPELQRYAAGSAAAWRADSGVPYELVEAGGWRQLSLYEEGTGWDESVCAALAATCAHLMALKASAAGRREMGLKIKLFELGAHSALRPHFGVTNRRIFLHMAVNLPTSGASYLRVGAGEARAFEAVGQRLLFDDSFEHEVWNEGGEPRHVLGIELVHPDASPSLR